MFLATPKQIYRGTESKVEGDINIGLASFPTCGRLDRTFTAPGRSWPDSLAKADSAPAHQKSSMQVEFIGQYSSRVPVHLSQRPPSSTSDPHSNMLHLISAISSLVQRNSPLIHVHHQQRRRNSRGISKGSCEQKPQLDCKIYAVRFKKEKYIYHDREEIARGSDHTV